MLLGSGDAGGCLCRRARRSLDGRRAPLQRALRVGELRAPRPELAHKGGGAGLCLGERPLSLSTTSRARQLSWEAAASWSACRRTAAARSTSAAASDVVARASAASLAWCSSARAVASRRSSRGDRCIVSCSEVVDLGAGAARRRPKRPLSRPPAQPRAPR